MQRAVGSPRRAHVGEELDLAPGMRLSCCWGVFWFVFKVRGFDGPGSPGLMRR